MYRCDHRKIWPRGLKALGRESRDHSNGALGKTAAALRTTDRTSYPYKRDLDSMQCSRGIGSWLAPRLSQPQRSGFRLDRHIAVV